MAPFFLSKELVENTIGGSNDNMALRIMLNAVGDHNIRIVLAQHDPRPFHDALLVDYPYIALIGDDDPAKGPESFHLESLKKTIRNVDYALVISGQAKTDLYRFMSLIPSFLRVNSMIVETLPEQEAVWSDFIRGENPDLKLLIHSTDPASGLTKTRCA